MDNEIKIPKISIPKLSTIVISDIISNLDDVDICYILNKLSRSKLIRAESIISNHLYQRNQKVINEFRNTIKEKKHWQIKAVSVELAPDYTYTDRRKTNLEIYINLESLPHIYVIFNHDGSCVIPCLSDNIIEGRWNFKNVYEFFDKNIIYNMVNEDPDLENILWVGELCDYLEEVYVKWIDPN